MLGIDIDEVRVSILDRVQNLVVFSKAILASQKTIITAWKSIHLVQKGINIDRLKVFIVLVVERNDLLLLFDWVLALIDEEKKVIIKLIIFVFVDVKV